MSEQQALEEYKGQQSNERGFRFLKDPMFFASSVFLKSPQRIMALALVMGLCLLVYNLGQRQLRQALRQANQTLPNQLGKSTPSPTLRWVFQCFMAVHFVVLNQAKQVVNLNDDRHRILQFFGSACRRYCLLCEGKVNSPVPVESAECGFDEAVKKLAQLQVIWVDQGYSGDNFAQVVKQVCGDQVAVEVIERTSKTFERLSKRWIVERTFGWFNRFRRLSKDYELYLEVSRAVSL